MSKRVAFILKALAVIFIGVFAFTQIYRSLVSPVTTDTVYSYSSYSGYDTSVIIIRNEKVVTAPETGSLGFNVENGGRIAKGGTIASIYSASVDAERSSEKERLEERIATLEKVQQYNDLNSADVEALNTKIHNELSNIIAETQNGSVTLSDSYDNLLEALNRRQIVTAQVQNFDNLIASLKAERDALVVASAKPVGTVTADCSGYVIYSVDGYEDSVNIDGLDTVNADMIKSVSPSEVKSDSVCKIVGDYEWYLLATVPFSESLRLTEGMKLYLKTSLASVPKLKVTVKHINKQSAGNDAAVVFSCTTMNTELASARKLDVSIIYEEHDGLKVDNRAIRSIDGKKGVYVLTYTQVKYVPIEVLWQGDNYSIVKKEAYDTGVLRIYDEIIVKGKNLYDGKIIDR